MCSEEFKLAEEDLPFLCWASDFLASLYNKEGHGGGGVQGDREGACVFVYVCLTVFVSHS